MCGMSVTVRTTKFRSDHGQRPPAKACMSFLFLQTKAPGAADVHADHAVEVFYPTQAEAEAAALKLGCTGIGRLLRPLL